MQAAILSLPANPLADPVRVTRELSAAVIESSGKSDSEIADLVGAGDFTVARWRAQTADPTAAQFALLLCLAENEAVVCLRLLARSVARSMAGAGW